MFTVTCLLTLKDLRKIFIQSILNKKRNKVLLWILVILIILLFVFILSTNSLSTIFSFSFFLQIWWIFLLPLFFIIYNNIITKSYNTNVDLQSEIKFIINSQNIKVKTIRSETIRAWNELYSIKYLKDYILIYPDSVIHWVIPKRELTEEHVQLIAEYSKDLK